MSSPSPVVELRDAVVLIGGFPLLSGVNLELAPQSLTVVTGSTVGLNQNTVMGASGRH